LVTGASTWGAELVERVLVGAAAASAARGGTGASSAGGGDEEIGGGDEAFGRGDADAASAVDCGELVGDEAGEPAASTSGVGEGDGGGAVRAGSAVVADGREGVSV